MEKDRLGPAWRILTAAVLLSTIGLALAFSLGAFGSPHSAVVLFGIGLVLLTCLLQAVSLLTVGLVYGEWFLTRRRRRVRGLDVSRPEVEALGAKAAGWPWGMGAVTERARPLSIAIAIGMFVLFPVWVAVLAHATFSGRLPAGKAEPAPELEMEKELERQRKLEPFVGAVAAILLGGGLLLFGILTAMDTMGPRLTAEKATTMILIFCGYGGLTFLGGISVLIGRGLRKGFAGVVAAMAWLSIGVFIFGFLMTVRP